MADANHTASKDTSVLRICRTCNVEQPLSKFYFTRQYPWKDCKACESVKTRAKRNDEHDKFREKARTRDAKLKMTRAELTQQELSKWVTYDPETGLFTRLIFKGKCRPGDKIGGTNHDGYVVFRVGGKKHLAHRLAWLYIHGKWPENELDHVNRIRDDNRICNLRESSRVANAQNTGSPVMGNKSGYQGVSPYGSKWKAKICVLGKQIYLGNFDDPAEAHQTYLDAKKKYHPTFTL
jgi:hypothetical protein